MEPELFVKTSASGQTGIHWRKIVSNKNQPEETPSIVKQKVIQKENGRFFIVNDLIDEYRPSLLIYRGKEGDEKKLLVEVFGIESPNRSSQMRRKVLNAIAWIFDDNDENEKLVRKIAYTILQGILNQDAAIANLIENGISFYLKEEFRVEQKQVEEFIDQVKLLNVSDELMSNGIEPIKIENRSNKNLENLAEELKKYRLPKKDGVLVVVTEDLEIKTILHEANVWRGFANKVEEPLKPIEPPIDPIDPIEDIETQEKKQEETTEKKTPMLPNRTIPILTILALLLIVSILLMILWLKHQKEIENLQPQPKQPLNQSEPIQPKQPLNQSEPKKIEIECPPKSSEIVAVENRSPVTVTKKILPINCQIEPKTKEIEIPKCPPESSETVAVENRSLVTVTKKILPINCQIEPKTKEIEIPKT
jgi:hypothetical protein